MAAYALFDNLSVSDPDGLAEYRSQVKPSWSVTAADTASSAVSGRPLRETTVLLFRSSLSSQPQNGPGLVSLRGIPAPYAS